MDDNLLHKLQREEPLTAEEALRLDQALQEQESVRLAVAKLPDPAPSLQWRSALNERLVSVQPRPKRRAWGWWVGGATAGLAAAGTLFALAYIGSREQSPLESSPGDGSFEMMLVESHRDSELALSLDTDLSF